MGERSPAREAQGTFFPSQPLLAQPSGFIILPTRSSRWGGRGSGARAVKGNVAPALKGTRPCSALPLLSLPGRSFCKPLRKRFPRQAGAELLGGEGGRDVGGEGAAALQQSADEWSLCAHCCSARYHVNLLQRRKKTGPAPLPPSARPQLPAPPVRCLLSGPLARTGHAAPQIAPDLGHLVWPKRFSPAGGTRRGGHGMVLRCRTRGGEGIPPFGRLWGAARQHFPRPTTFGPQKGSTPPVPPSCRQRCEPPKQDRCQVRKSFPALPWGSCRG